MRFEGDLKPKFFQTLPKKICISRKIEVNYKGYQANISFWIMNCPYSKDKPMLSMTISHGRIDNRQYVRFNFEHPIRAWCFLDDISRFLEEYYDTLLKALDEAINEWKELHEKHSLTNNEKNLTSLNLTNLEKNA